MQQPRRDSMDELALWRSLTTSAAQIRLLDAAQPTLDQLPLRTWAGLTAIAISGSLIYGASLALVLPRWRPHETGLWLTASAGLSWCVFGPVLVRVSQRSPFTCAHACLVSMA